MIKDAPDNSGLVRVVTDSSGMKASQSGVSNSRPSNTPATPVTAHVLAVNESMMAGSVMNRTIHNTTEIDWRMFWLKEMAVRK